MLFNMSIAKPIQKFCIVCGSPTEFKIPEGDNKERAVCDFIAGMTDRYAIKLYNSLK